MKVHAAFVYLAIPFALGGVRANASKIDPVLTRAFALPSPASEVAKPSPASLASFESPATRHVFPVSDEKGLLLSCIAPEIDINRETDVFKDCVLAPGRTLDDVMHSFIRGIHQEERLLQNERRDESWESGQKADGKAAEK